MAGKVLLVGHLFHPFHVLAVELLRNGDMRHRGGRRRAVPMPVVRRTPDDVTSTDFDNRLTLALRPADTLGDDQGLTQWMGMPGGARTGLEGNEAGGDAGR